jgi:hypothetical protein
MTITKSEKYFAAKNAEAALPPKITSTMLKGVSDWRKNQLAGEVESGLYRDGSGSVNTGLTSASYVVSSGLQKSAQAALTSGSGGSNWRGGSGNNVQQMNEVYSPLFLTSNTNLPRDRATINAWCRSFFALNPIVQNAIGLHSTYPLSKLNIKCPNKRVETFFNDMIEEIGLMNICVQAAQEFWLLGEVFIYAELDERAAKWSKLIIQNPDYIAVKKSIIASEPIIMLRPDENLRRIVFSNKPSDIEQKKQLNETIIQHVKRGENIPLDNFYVSHLARRISPYEIRGTGLPVACFRNLMLMDQYRECDYAQASDMTNPITVVKIGGAAEYRPGIQDLEAWRATFEQGQSDRNFKIFTHDGVSIERVGAGQAIYDTSGKIQQLIKEIYIGLMMPQVLMDGGGDVTYANGGITLDVLRQRYMQFRNMMASWLRKKIFAPISKLNEFYDNVDGMRKLIVPEVEWSHMSLFDTNDYIQVLVQLSGDQKKVSQQTLYRSLGLEYDEERRKIRKEDIQDAIRKKELVSLDRMPLNELRTLNDEDEIPETTETPIGIDSPYTDQTGTPPSDAGGLGGLPPLPGMSPPGGEPSLPPPSGPPPA